LRENRKRARNITGGNKIKKTAKQNFSLTEKAVFVFF
jgi:hypothetical protein